MQILIFRVSWLPLLILEEMAFEACTIFFTVKDRPWCLKYNKGDRLSKRWRTVRSCTKTGCFVEFGVGVRLVWHYLRNLLFSFLLVFWMQAFFTVFWSLEKIGSEGGSQLGCLCWLYTCTMVLRTLLSLQIIVRPFSFSYPVTSANEKVLPPVHCHFHSIFTFAWWNSKCMFNCFLPVSRFSWSMNLSSKLGGQEQQNIEWWKLFLSLWIMIIPFLSCEPFVPLSMSWSCLRRPFQVSRMEVVKFISGLIAVAFSSFGCFESVGSGDKGASTFDVAPSFSINLMIEFAVLFNRDRWFIPFFASTGCQATTKASDPYPVQLQSYCKHWISKMMAQMLASTDNAWRGEGSAVNRFGMNLKAL